MTIHWKIERFDEDEEQDPALAVDGDKGRGLIEVDLQAPTDDVSGVVGAALLLRALEQAAHDFFRVDGELDNAVEAAAIGLEHHVQLMSSGR